MGQLCCYQEGIQQAICVEQSGPLKVQTDERTEVSYEPSVPSIRNLNSKATSMSLASLESKPSMLEEEEVSETDEADLLSRTESKPFAGHVSLKGPFSAEDAMRAGFFSFYRPPELGEEVVCFQRNHWLKRGIVTGVEEQVSNGRDGLKEGAAGVWVTVQQQDASYYHCWAAFLATSKDMEYSSLCLQAEYENSKFFRLRREIYGSTVTHETRVTKPEARRALEAWLHCMIDADGEAVEVSPEMAKELLDIFDVQQDASLHLYSLHKRLGPRTDARKGRDYSLYYQALNNTLNHDTELSLRAALPLIRRMTYLLLYDEKTGEERRHSGGTVWKGDSERPAPVTGKVINNGKPRFDLFHFEWSICSWKVRAVLSAKGVPWRSWTLDPAKRHHYHPAYVRLRALGHFEGALVGEVFNGSSGATSQGFDPLAVPTLVDREKKTVVVDSKAICQYLDQELPLVPLTYPEWEVLINKHLDLVDETPHMGLIYGLHFADDIRDPVVLKYAQLMKGARGGQLAAVGQRLGGELPPQLRGFYEAKRRKIRMASETLSRAAVLEMHQKVQEILGILEQDLRAIGNLGDFFCGTLSLVDVFWHSSLLRLFELGFDGWFSKDRLPRVHAQLWQQRGGRSELYAMRILRDPVLARATYLWPYKPVTGNVRKLMSETVPLKAVPLNQKRLQMAMRHQVPIRFRQFQSTTSDRKVAERFQKREDHPGFLWTIEIPENYFGARNIQDVSSRSNESETLFPPYSAFEVLDLERDRCRLRAVPYRWDDESVMSQAQAPNADSSCNAM
ncbi:unnamed protein product [Effrenium voratum]|nr:unnamed protein product [Effrenium voratum]